MKTIPFFFVLSFLFFCASLQAQEEIKPEGKMEPEVKKILATIATGFYNPFEEGLIACRYEIEFSVEKPIPILVFGKVARKKGEKDEFKIIGVEPPELEPFAKSMEKGFLKQIERISLPNFVELFERFDLKVIEKSEKKALLAGKAKDGEKRALKVFIEENSVQRVELLLVLANPRDPENPRKIKTVQTFHYTEFDGVKVIKQMKVATDLGEMEADFSYIKVEGFLFPKMVATKLGPIETAYFYKNYQLEVETGEF